MTTLRQLRYLDALAQTGHFGRAAERVGVSQPALSTQIRDLEAGLGVPLVERLPSGARLTETGREIAARAARILVDVREIEELARARSGVFAGPMRIGVIPSIAPYLLPRLLPELVSRYPGLDLLLRETMTDTLMRELVEGTLDVIVASLPLAHPLVETATLYSEDFLLVSAGFAAAENEPVEIADLSRQRLLLLEDGHCLREQVLRACGRPAADAERSGGATNLRTLVELVANGQGVTLVPELFARFGEIDTDRTRTARFADPAPARQVALAWRRTHPLADRFGEMAAVVAAAVADGDRLPPD